MTQHADHLDDHDCLVAANQDLQRTAERQRVAFEDLLTAIWLYVPWRFVTKQLETVQKDLWADAIDASRVRMYAGDPDIEPGTVERWWRQ